jgi:hypothetical protein
MMILMTMMRKFKYVTPAFSCIEPLHIVVHEMQNVIIKHFASFALLHDNCPKVNSKSLTISYIEMTQEPTNYSRSGLHYSLFFHYFVATIQTCLDVRNSLFNTHERR